MDQRDSELALNYLMSAGVVAYQRAIAHVVGDALAGLFFSQLWYWSGRQPEDRGGWFFMTQDQLFTETAMTRREQETSRKKLRALGILEEELRGHPAKLWYRINIKKMIQLLENGSYSQFGGKRQTRLYENAKLGCTKTPDKFVRNVQPSKISTKNSSKTSAATVKGTTHEGEETRPDAAAEVLVRELIAQGVSRTVATRLAKEKPHICRRCLEYLPYATFRTTKGAWLASAIRDEFGPPAGYLDAKRREQRARASKDADARKTARQADEDSLRREELARLGETLHRLENEQGEAYLAFTEHFRGERGKAERIAEQLSPQRAAECLAAFDAEEHRIELFGRWLDQGGSRVGGAGPRHTTPDRRSKPGLEPEPDWAPGVLSGGLPGGGFQAGRASVSSY